jgi:hypothetical protein
VRSKFGTDQRAADQLLARASGRTQKQFGKR